ncbi:MAG: polyprenyl diphosphate synthase [Candidatus Aenigmarchaeota archaeon]|nr:polyprenyl diphosphate synthase [Candidatus Aenigmarchaeota archaeon]MDI6722356.1 polyprenyl diphosphate synthase [Candidatus Aenigmarchaeota archaeon]
MIPVHIGVILDGNRRFAKQLMQVPWMGHKWGLEKAREVLQWACEAGVKYITAYTLSLENLKTRPQKELDFILDHLEKEADNILGNTSHIVHRLSVRVRFIGRLNQLPDSIQEKFRKVENATSQYKNHFLNIAVAYGGQQEIVDAMKRILENGLKGTLKPSDLDENILKEHLYTNGQPYPDMVFRTGGEKRLSNFMPFQTAYSELIFTDKKWPELTKEDFDSALREFAERKRRFGA